MPITDTDDARRVEDHIRRIFSADRPVARADAIRRLFVEVLDFRGFAGQVPLAGAATGVVLPDTAYRVAQLDGVQVLYIALDTPETDKVRKAEASAAAELIADQLGDDLLLVFTNTSASQLHLILPDLAAARPSLRRMTIEAGSRQRTAFEQIAGIYRVGDSRPVRQALTEAFNVERVTRDFFREYRRIFEAAKEHVTGTDSDEERHLFVQTVFNRLMFVQFLSRKGWLAFGDGDDRADYLNALWKDYEATPDDRNFYADRLAPLFFLALNNESSTDELIGGRILQAVVGEAPFLNGGLFDPSELDKRGDITVPDDAIKPVLTELFNKFNFTVMESTPFDIEVAVDPEMLGKVFEETLLRRERGQGPDDRRASGTYYTPRQVVWFMCREALKQYLDARETGLTPEAIAAFVDEHDTAAIGVAAARRVAEALGDVRVVDPACGSGAYLLGMMQELVELQRVLFNAGAAEKTLHQLKLEIIERNLRGADLDPFAAHIAQLRLWLSLTIEGDEPRPLPNLDLTIVTGDSLLAAHAAEGGVQGALGDAANELWDLKTKYMHTSAGPAKAALRAQIAGLDRDLRERFGGLGAADAGGAVEWHSAFPEVFEARDGHSGFDIVIANPPYHQLQRDGGRLANLYRNVGYRTFARTGDIYQLFFERGCELLKPDTGILAYITSNSWLRAEYGKQLRRFFAERHTPLRWLDLGKDVFESAIVDSGVLLLRTGGGETSAFPAADMDDVPSTSFPPAENEWGRVRPVGEAPWSILSLAEQRVMETMRERGTPLAEWEVSMNYGIKTGYNEAFIIDDATRRALVAADPKSADITKPVLRGRDIRRYRAEWAGKWLVDTHNGHGDVPAVDVDAYPAVKAHLTTSWARLEQRSDQGRTPYHLRDCAYYEEFSKPKLFWMDMSPEGRFAYSEDTTFCNNKGFIMVGGPLKYFCALLNSSLITWMMRSTARTTGVGLPQWEKFAVERIPLPRVSEEKQRPFVELVNGIIEAKTADPDADTGEWEQAIDGLVYDLYGLTEDEATAVERRLGLAVGDR